MAWNASVGGWTDGRRLSAWRTVAGMMEKVDNVLGTTEATSEVPALVTYRSPPVPLLCFRHSWRLFISMSPTRSPPSCSKIPSHLRLVWYQGWGLQWDNCCGKIFRRHVGQDFPCQDPSRIFLGKSQKNPNFFHANQNFSTTFRVGSCGFSLFF